MSKCLNRATGDMLYEYELGLLSDTDSDLVEAHLLECSHCSDLLLEHQEVSELMREDGEVRKLIAKLGQEPKPQPRSRRFRLGWRPLALAAGLAVLLILKPWNIQFQPTDEVVASDRLMVVMPIDNLVDEGDSERLAMIATELIATDLSESRFLRVVSGQTVADLSDALVAAESDDGDPLNASLTVARAARAAYLLTGRIIQVNPSLVLTAQVVDVASGEIMLSHRVGTDREGSIFDLVDELAARIGNDLLVPLGFDDQYNPDVAEVTTASAQAYRHYIEGREFMRRMYLDDARRSFERALQFDSTFAMCYYHLGANFDLELIEQAVKYSQQASHRERQHILGLEAMAMDDLIGAAAILRELVEAYPEDVMGWTMAARVALRQNHVSEAIALLDEAIKYNPVHKRAINLQAYLYQQIGETERAVATVDTYIAMVPGEPNPYDTKADILSESGRIEEAIENYQMVLSIKPDFDGYGTALELGQLYKYRGDYDRARQNFQDAATNGGLSSRSSARTNLALLPFYQGRLADGWRVLADGMGADRLDKAAAAGHGPGQKNHFVAAMVHLGVGEFNQAVERLATVIEIAQGVNPDDSLSYRALYAFALTAAGHHTSADSVLQQMERHSDDNEVSADVYLIGRGFVAAARDDYVATIKELEQLASGGSRKGFSIRYWLGRAYLESGQPEKAVAEFLAILDDYSDPYRTLMVIWDVQTHYYLANSYEASGQPEEAIAEFDIFVNLWKDADPVLRPMVDEAKRRLALLKQGIQ